jgi:hypothetical protein
MVGGWKGGQIDSYREMWFLQDERG